MRSMSKMMTAAFLVATIGVGPALADPGRGNGHGNGNRHHARHNDDRGDRHHNARNYGHCPPGLAKKNPPCIPPGQVRNHVRYGNSIGDVLRIGDYLVINDPRRYNLQQRDGWRYYRDDNNIYRVDSGTQKVLAVLNLIQAFSN